VLHLKSGIAFLEDGVFVAIDALAAHPAFKDRRVIRVDADEAYAANCIRVNDATLIAKGFPRLEAALSAEGYRTLALDVSEFRKMDGGLSCLSLRY